MAWLGFALAYTGHHEWLAPRSVWILLIVPILTCIAVAANNANHLIWQNYTLKHEAGLVIFHAVTYGRWFWVHAIYSYFLGFAGVVLIGRTYLRAPALYQRQAK